MRLIFTGIHVHINISVRFKPDIELKLSFWKLQELFPLG